ncbi:MAG: hypothetical protein N3A69_16530, partial [Leptospiraceae bacterium]|nr:hypothetical protein [Leptospiraceae bacterium]
MKSVVLNSKAYAEEKSKAFKMMINIELQNLEELCKDWAFWDDTYEFIENRNKNYIASNLVESTFRDARINLIIFLNKNDEIVYSKFYNERWEEKEIDEIFLKREFMKKTGFMKFGQHLILISSKPILKSDLSGEERGHLLMGRILDDEWFFKISEALNVKIQLKDVKEVYNEKIVARTEVEDILGEKLVFALEFTNPNYIDHIRDIFLYIFSFLILVLFFYSTTIFLIDRELISKISRLEMFVSKAKAGDRVEVTGVDEINELTSGINRMLSRIEKKERETNFLLKILKHDLMNVLASLSGYLEIMKLEGKLNNLEKAEKQIDRGVTLI